MGDPRRSHFDLPLARIADERAGETSEVIPKRTTTRRVMVREAELKPHLHGMLKREPGSRSMNFVPPSIGMFT